MNGFYIAIGKQGSGKTLMITKLMIEHRGDRPIYSNYSLTEIPYQKITLSSILDQLEDDPNHFNHSVMLLDEIHLYLDSLDFMRKNNRRLQTFFSQLRKRDILLLATTQYLMNVDIRIRRQCMAVFEMSHVYQDLFGVITHEIDGYFTREVSSYNVVLSDYYDQYDTKELIIE